MGSQTHVLCTHTWWHYDACISYILLTCLQQVYKFFAFIWIRCELFSRFLNRFLTQILVFYTFAVSNSNPSVGLWAKREFIGISWINASIFGCPRYLHMHKKKKNEWFRLLEMPKLIKMFDLMWENKKRTPSRIKFHEMKYFMLCKLHTKKLDWAFDSTKTMYKSLHRTSPLLT